MKFAHLSAVAAGLATSFAAAPAFAEEAAIDWSLVYKGDASGVLAGGASRAGRYLDNIDLAATFDMGRLAGWQGARLYGHVLSNSGGAPNDVAGTLQGVNNIEVERHRVKLYQLWLEQDFADGRGSILGGLYDLNSEFYVTENAGDLIAPAFGIGSELAATGPNGPSIFPSTALSLRLSWQLTERQRVQFALVNANAGVLGDPDGIDEEFDEGALVIGEWVREGDASLRIGAWRYSDEQDDIRETDGLGAPLQQVAHGAYVAAETPLGSFGAGDVTGFVRIGISDGDTTDFSGGWQAGLRMGPVFAARPDSAFTIGVNQGVVSSKFRDNQRDLGADPAHAESALELTYVDRIGPHLSLQPDLHIIHNPGADADRDNVVVATLRVIIEL